jgi:tyrosyl-tRNA synthetase
MVSLSRLDRVLRGTSEVLTLPELEALLKRPERPRAYIGYEPSGRLTVGQLVTVRKVQDLVQAGFDVTVYLADWHALINDKLGGSLERIRAAGEVMQGVFRSLGTPEEVRFRWASDLLRGEGYWTRVVRVAKSMSLARAKRAMTILGRREEEADLDLAKMLYPAMQVADIFELPVDLAYAGMDQRKAHVLAREVAHHHHWPVPVAIHTPLISSLRGGGRMNPTDGGIPQAKMSKSDPASTIPIPASRELVEERLRGAFCPPREVEGNPVVELALHVVFPWEGALEIEAPRTAGPAKRYTGADEFQDAWKRGEVHPADLKAAVSRSLQRILEPANRYFENSPRMLQALDAEGPEKAG